MKEKEILRDKINQARIMPSPRAWQKIEGHLESERRSNAFRRRTVIGWAAAVLIIVMAFYAGRYGTYSPVYMPVTLELNDQAGEIHLPHDFYQFPTTVTKYRNDGRLIPNYQTLWKNPLVPRERNL